MNKSFSRFTLAAYMLLMVAFFTIVTAGLGIVPGIAITLSLLLMDAATGPKSTLIYGLVSIFTAPVFDLYTWIHKRFDYNLQKEQAYKETNSFKTTPSPADELPIVTNNSPCLSPSSPLSIRKENLEESKVAQEDTEDKREFRVR